MACPIRALAATVTAASTLLVDEQAFNTSHLWFREAWARTGKKLDMGKSCVRFKKLSDLPLEVIGEMIKRVPAQKYIAQYQATLAKTSKGGAKKAAAAKSEPAAKKSAAAKKVPAVKKAGR